MSAATAPAVGTRSGGTAVNLVRSEYRKIRTTNTWWLFGLFTLILLAITLLFNMLQAHFYLTSPPPGADDPTQAAQFGLQSQAATQAANIFTSGQFFGGLFVMLLAILMITNEYYHQTATTTYLITPRRTAVIGAKFVMAIVAAAFFWLVITAIDLTAGAIYLHTEHVSAHLGDWVVQRAILVNLMVFALWGVFGVGLGVLIRSQIGATITAALLYVIGTQLAQLVFFLIRQFLIKKDGVLTAMVIVPATAAQIAVSAVQAFPQAPPWWVGALVLLGYGVVTGLIGIAIMRRRDIS